MEEYVYKSSWERTASGFKVWLSESPFSQAEGETVHAAVRKLCDTIADDGGSVTPSFQFAPPLPKGERESIFYQTELYLVTGDDRFEPDSPRDAVFSPPEVREVARRWFEQFYTGVACRVCRIPGGPRNEQRLPLRNAGSGYDGGFSTLGCASVRIYSEAFLDLLTQDERSQLVLQPVARSGRARKQFFELIGPSGPPHVAVKTFPTSGWQCSACGGKFFRYFDKELSCGTFVARTDLPKPLPDIFTVGDYWQVELCIKGSRWKELVGKRGTKGLLAAPLGVLDDDFAVREPQLRKRGQQEAC